MGTERQCVSPFLAVLTQLEQAVNPGGRLKHVQWEFRDVMVSLRQMECRACKKSLRRMGSACRKSRDVRKTGVGQEESALNGQ
jgi:hypothetical protein